MNESILRGDLFYADLNPVIGSEQGGIRPVLILQNNVGNRHSFLYRLYELLWLDDVPMESLTEHLEGLYDRAEYHGFLYLIVMLAESVGVTLPLQFYEYSKRELVIPILSGAIIEDWLDIDGEYEEVEE